MMGLIEKLRRFLWAFVEIAFLLVLALVLATQLGSAFTAGCHTEVLNSKRSVQQTYARANKERLLTTSKPNRLCSTSSFLAA